MSVPHPASLSDEALLEQSDMRFGRTSGPGGQHRNKVETLVELTHRDTGVVSRAGERRSQADNKRVALFRLRLALAETIRRAPATDVSALWVSRCRGGRVKVNPAHRDFPMLLAEALDHIYDAELEPRAAAETLSISTSQLIKLIKLHPSAFIRWNAARAKAGKHPLK